MIFILSCSNNSDRFAWIEWTDTYPITNGLAWLDIWTYNHSWGIVLTMHRRWFPNSVSSKVLKLVNVAFFNPPCCFSFHDSCTIFSLFFLNCCRWDCCIIPTLFQCCFSANTSYQRSPTAAILLQNTEGHYWLISPTRRCCVTKGRWFQLRSGCHFIPTSRTNSSVERSFTSLYEHNSNPLSQPLQLPTPLRGPSVCVINGLRDCDFKSASHSTQK